MSAPLRVVVADDERRLRSFLVALLRSIEGVTIVGEAESGLEAVAVLERARAVSADLSGRRSAGSS